MIPEYYDCEIFFPSSTQYGAVVRWVREHTPLWHWGFNEVCPRCSVYLKFWESSPGDREKICEKVVDV